MCVDEYGENWAVVRRRRRGDVGEGWVEYVVIGVGVEFEVC